jgi:uncharacterized protein (DUF885 family)
MWRIGMRQRTPYVVVLSLFLAVSYPARPSDARGAPGNTILKKACDDYWERQLADSPYLRLRHGLPIAKLPDVSLRKSESEAAFAKSMLARLQAVKPGDLSHEELLSLELLRWNLEDTVEGARFYWLTSAVTPYASPIPGTNQVFTAYQFRNRSDLAGYLALLGQYPAFVGQILENVRTQYEKRILVPKDELKLVLAFAGSLIREAEHSPFYVSRERLSQVSEGEAVQFQKEVSAQCAFDFHVRRVHEKGPGQCGTCAVRRRQGVLPVSSQASYNPGHFA